jgi:hypothetical protein
VYDPVRAHTVLFGGRDTSIGNTFSDTWYFDGRSWTTGPSGAPARSGHGMVYDADRDEVVLFGGFDVNNFPVNDAWKLKAQWTVAPDPGTKPSPRAGMAMVYDPFIQRSVMFGGLTSGGVVGDTWQFNGLIWEQPAPPTAPPARSNTGIAFDQKRRRSIVFGGDGAAGRLGDSWEYDNALPGEPPNPTWYPRTLATSPPPSASLAMAYDPIRDRVVAQLGLSGTWQLGGTAWTALGLTPAPLPRIAPSLAYATVLGRIVMFGGSTSGGTDLADTWTLGYKPIVAGEACASGVDYDHDGKIGCDDDDCWGVCTPQCPPGTTCPPNNHRCGDTICSPFEDCRSCPGDCLTLGTTACPTVCGDFLCDPSEDASSCPGDCP